MFPFGAFYYPELYDFMFPPEPRPQIKAKKKKKDLTADVRKWKPVNAIRNKFVKKIPRCRGKPGP